MVEVDLAKVQGHAEVGDDVHWFLRNRTGANFDTVIGVHAGLFKHPYKLRVSNPPYVLSSVVSSSPIGKQ